MKTFTKILLMLMICILPLVSVAQTATPTDIATPTDFSPYIVVWPRLTYWHPYAYPSLEEYEDLFTDYFYNEKYIIDDVFYLKLDDYTEVVNFEFIRMYYPTEQVILCVDGDTAFSVLKGFVTPHRTVTFNFSDIAPGVYRIYVVRGLPNPVQPN